MELDFNQFYQSFFEESLEMLEDMEKTLLELDLSNPLDSETINRIFRAAHSIKGGSATFGFKIISEFTHTLESFLTQVREGNLKLNQHSINLLLKAVDLLRLLIADIKQQKTSNLDAIHALQENFIQLQTAKVLNENTNKPTQTINDKTVIGWDINFQPNENIFLSGNDPLRLLQVLAEWGVLQSTIDISRLPTFDQVNLEACYLSWQLKLLAPVSKQEIEEVFEWVIDDSRLIITPLYNEANNLLEAVNNTANASSSPNDTLLNDSAKNILENTSVRVSTNKIDTLINIIGELVITRSSLTQLCKDFKQEQLTELQEILAQFELNCQELQQQALRIRMLPVSSVFNRFPRLVRDCAEQLHKQVELHIEGGQTEIDKSLLEKLVDPLQHLLRNAVDHGIEMPDVRIAAGKSPVGSIQLTIYQQGGSIIIEIMDDGAGLSREKIYAKALAGGFINEQEILTDNQLYELIFKPGFSTAESITEVSGRGVGMDVVMQNIHTLGGNIAIHSTPSAGTVFTLRMPLTLAIMDCQLTLIGEQIYIIPLNTIVEIIKIEQKNIQQLADGSQLYQLRSNYIPIINSKEVLDITTANSATADQFLVIVETNNQLFGLTVDDLLAQQQIVIKSLEENYQKIEGIAGATILGDGSVALILDVNHIITRQKADPVNKTFHAEGTHENNSNQTVNMVTQAPETNLQVLSFKLAEQEYAIDILNVIEIRSWEKITPLPKTPDYVRGVINLRGIIVPVIDLRTRFNLTMQQGPLTSIVILKLVEHSKNRLVGVIVDAVSDTCNFTYSEVQPVPENNDSLLAPAMLGVVTINEKMLALLHIGQLLPRISTEYPTRGKYYGTTV